MTDPESEPSPPGRSIGALLSAARAVLAATDHPGPDGTTAELAAALPALRRAVEGWDRAG